MHYSMAYSQRTISGQVFSCGAQDILHLQSMTNEWSLRAALVEGYRAVHPGKGSQGDTCKEIKYSQSLFSIRREFPTWSGVNT